nr:2OG-Fe(II) oxygenase [Ningiella ruwaisensis]
MEDEQIFEQIALDLLSKGYCVLPKALPLEICDALHFHMVNMPEYKFTEASIGRKLDNQQNAKIRNDEIAWINGESPAGQKWLQWTHALQMYLNRRLFLGLFSFESHFAHYAPGHFYKRHFDAFKGETNRILSLVTYLNPSWEAQMGGELQIYENTGDESGLKVLPEYGTLCVFLSEEFEHEVKPATAHRYSIAGWFRVNTSTAEKVDPPA